MNIEELEKQLKEEKEWLKECERNILLSKAEIEHLESCIKEAKKSEKVVDNIHGGVYNQKCKR